MSYRHKLELRTLVALDEHDHFTFDRVHEVLVDAVETSIDEDELFALDRTYDDAPEVAYEDGVDALILSTLRTH